MRRTIRGRWSGEGLALHIEPLERRAHFAAPAVVDSLVNHVPFADAGGGPLGYSVGATDTALRLDATSSSDLDGEPLTFGWDLNGDNFSEQRRRMSNVIIAESAGKPNVLLAGDTNAKPTNQAMRNVELHLKSVFGNRLTTSFNMRRKDNPGYATAVVDLMYVSPTVRIVSYDCPDVDISDHLPLIATVRL